MIGLEFLHTDDVVFGDERADGIEGIDIDIAGGPTIGTGPDTLTIERSESTNSSGEVELNEIDPGDYNITNLATLGNSEYEYVGADSLIPIHLISGDDKEVNLIFAKKNIDSLLVVVKNSVSDELIEGAEVKISNTSGFEQTTTTSADGRVYFPVTEDPPVLMTAEEYDIEVKAVNFVDYSDSENVNDLTTHDALMTPE